MTADTITAIKKALEGVTMQEWTFDGPADSIIIWCGTDTRVCFMTSDGPAKAHAQFITACQPVAITELLSTLESLQRENEGLREELTGTQTANQCMTEDFAAMKARAEGAESELKGLREKLEPFAKESERWEPRGSVFWSDDTPFPANTMSTLTIGDLRRARTALSSTGDTHGN